MTPRIVDREEKRGIILQAAHNVFARKGIGRTTIAEVATEAGIGKGTVYEYFESKEVLIRELVEATFQSFDRQIGELPAVEDCSPENFLQVLMESLSGAPELEESVPFFFEAIAMAARGELPGITERMGEWFDSLARIFVPYIEEFQRRGMMVKAGDPFFVMRSLFAFLDGAMLHFFLFVDRKNETLVQQWETEIFLLVEGYLFGRKPEN